MRGGWKEDDSPRVEAEWRDGQSEADPVPPRGWLAPVIAKVDRQHQEVAKVPQGPEASEALPIEGPHVQRRGGRPALAATDCGLAEARVAAAGAAGPLFAIAAAAAATVTPTAELSLGGTAVGSVAEHHDEARDDVKQPHRGTAQKVEPAAVPLLHAILALARVTPIARVDGVVPEHNMHDRQRAEPVNRVGVEQLLRHDALSADPCLPAVWPDLLAEIWQVVGDHREASVCTSRAVPVSGVELQV